MNPKVVFFGEADYGKSTLIGFLYAHAYNVDLDRAEAKIRARIGNNYQQDYLYSSLINPDIWSSHTNRTVEIKSMFDAGTYDEGIQVIKETDDEIVIQSTTVIGDKVKIITQRHQNRVFKRFNSTTHHIKNIEIPYQGKTIRLSLIDTPGHVGFLNERELGISMSDIGVFCISINEILRDDFEEMLFAFEDLWSQYNYNKKIIYALTKFDLCAYSQEEYLLACDRIRKYCKRVRTNYEDVAFGTSISFSVDEDDAAAIIPVSVDFESRTGVNIIDLSDKCPWYKGPTLLQAIIDLMDELRTAYENHFASNLCFSIDKAISKPQNQVGQVWRIHIKNGSLSVGDRITLTSVRLSGRPKSVLFDINAEIKTIRREVDMIEGEKSSDIANKGDIVTIDIKNCTLGKKRIVKKDIQTTVFSVGYSEDEEYVKVDRFDLCVRKDSKFYEHIKADQNIVLLWNGRRVSAKVLDVIPDRGIISIRLLYDKTLDVPVSKSFLETDMFSRIKFFSESDGKLWYYSGKLKPIVNP